MGWATDHLALIVGVIAGLLLVGLVLSIVSLIAQGGLASATAELAGGRESSPGRAWRTGLHLFWRFAGLWLLLIAAALAIGTLVAAFVALVIGLVTLTQNTALVVAPAVLVGLVLVVAGIAAGIVASIVVPFAQRAIAVRDIGPLAALRDGWQVLRARPGASLLVWLLNLALTFGVGLLVTIALVVALLILGIPAALLWSAFELSAPTMVYLSAAGLVVFALLLALAAVSNTFMWTYWTLAYLRLRSDQPTDEPA